MVIKLLIILKSAVYNRENDVSHGFSGSSLLVLWPWQEICSLHCCHPTWSVHTQFCSRKLFSISGEFWMCWDAQASNKSVNIYVPHWWTQVMILNDQWLHYCYGSNVCNASHRHKHSCCRLIHSDQCVDSWYHLYRLRIL